MLVTKGGANSVAKKAALIHHNSSNSVCVETRRLEQRPMRQLAEVGHALKRQEVAKNLALFVGCKIRALIFVVDPAKRRCKAPLIAEHVPRQSEVVYEVRVNDERLRVILKARHAAQKCVLAKSAEHFLNNLPHGVLKVWRSKRSAWAAAALLI